MIDPRVFEKYKMTPEAYRAKMTAENPSVGIKKLQELTQSRIRDGVSNNLLNARLWWAIDRAFDTPFYQTAFTMLRGLIDAKRGDDKNILSMVKDLGLTHMLTNAPCSCNATPCTCQEKKQLNIPVFFDVFVPLVQAYVKIRWAKIFNDRDLYPIFKYEPVKLSTDNMIRSEIITDRIQYQASQLGYRSVKRQAIFQDLLYSFCVQFPMESWYREQQEDADGKKIIIKEGLRYALPHPSRTFGDKSHRWDTLNSDSGVAWAGYWHTSRYGDVKAQKGYWNTDKIGYGASDFTKLSSWSLYAQLYPCTIQFPAAQSGGTGDLDRESRNWFYGTNEEDKTVVTTELFQKIIPKDYELSDYEYPVWHRFVTANDSTNLYLEPFAYSPGIFYGYDYDGNRDLNAGMGLEILPFQDMVGNYLTQYLISVKRNLANCVWYNEDIVSPETIKEIVNEGDKFWRSLNMKGFSMKQLQYAQQDIKNAFYPVEFVKANTAEIIMVVKNVLDILERVLVMSSQEIGQAASHEQSASEVTIVAQNTGNRVTFTGGFVDDGIYAWKKQLYEAMMAYSSDEVFARVTRLNNKTKEQVEKLGFDVEEVEGETRMGVIGKKSALAMEGIASTRDGVDRINNPAVAATMVQLTQSFLAIPMVVEAVGLGQIVDWYNKVAVLIGLPQDFKITIKNDVSPEKQLEDARGQMEQVAAQVVNTNLGELVNKLKSEFIQPIEGALHQIGENQKAQAGRDDNQEAAILKQQQELMAVAEAVKKRLDAFEQVVTTIVSGASNIPGTTSGPSVSDAQQMAVGGGGGFV